MNCKPGDLARIIDHPAARQIGVVDRFVTCVKPVTTTLGHPAWWLEAPLTPAARGYPRIAAVEDFLLRPIGNPGDDVKSQETRKLPADAGIQQLRETVRAFRAMRDAGVCP